MDDERWQFRVPPKANADLAGVQHFIHHLAQQGMAGFVLAHGSMSSNQSGNCPARSASSKPKAKQQSLPRQRDIRRALIETDLVDRMVALPGQLIYSTKFLGCLWFMGENKAGAAPTRDRRKRTLFIDARKPGTLIARVHRELTAAELETITSTYHAWRRDLATKNRDPMPKTVTSSDADVAGFCRSATTTGIAAHAHVLTPGRHVRAGEVEADGDPFEETDAAPRRRTARRVREAWDPCAENAFSSTSDRTLAKIALALFHPDFSRFLYKRPESFDGLS